MVNTKIQVTETKNTGFLPDMGILNATKTEDSGIISYTIADERAGAQNGTQLTANQVQEV